VVRDGEGQAKTRSSPDDATKETRRETKAYLVQVDNVHLLSSDSVEETTLLVDVEDLHGLEDLGELSGSDIGVDVEELTVLGLSEGSEDGESSSSDGSLDGSLVDSNDLSNVSVLLPVEVLGGEDSGGDGSSSSSESFEGGNESEVLLEEDSLWEVR